MSNATMALNAAGPKSFDRLHAFTAPAVQAARQLAELNLQATKATMAELAENVQAAASAKTPNELMTLRVAALQAAPQKALAYGRHVRRILAAAATAQRQAAEAQMAEAQAKLLATVEGALKDAPGREEVLTLVKSAVATANNAYEGVKGTSSQVAAAVDANASQIAETVSSTASGALVKVDD